MLKKSMMCFLCALLLATPLYAEPLVSGFEFLSPEIQAMQLDDFENPGMTAVDHGQALYVEKGSNEKNCASCHGDEGSKLNKQRLASYPRYSKQLNRPLTLQDQLNLCWQDNLDNPPLVYGSKDTVALETYMRYLARGEVINVDVSGPMQRYYQAGQGLYNMRFGQIDMACVHCHDYYQGQYLRGEKLSQGHSNGFPVYRLQTGQVTSLHKRFSECFVSFRAEPFDLGSEEFINLEIYINARGNGLTIETPAVRN
jgi:sulfur-oxidizing protein SoxA